MSPELPAPSTPKRGKKVVPVVRVHELQQRDSPSLNQADVIWNVDLNQNDDDNKSLQSNGTAKSKANSTSSTRRLELEAELQALEELEKVEQEAFRKKKEAILKRLEVKKKLANERGDESDEQKELGITQPPDVPQSCPAAVVDDWLNNIPAGVPAEHPYAAAQGIREMNARMEKFMARQSVSSDLPPFSGEPEQWLAFYNAFQHTTVICGLRDDENLVRLNKCLTGQAREAVNPILGMPSNVSLIMDTLKMLFGRPNQILKSMIDKTRNLPDVQGHRPETGLQILSVT